jgi:PAS domain S-box-containing protein
MPRLSYRTGAKRAEACLQTARPPEASLPGLNRVVLDALGAQICILTADGTLLDANQAWREYAAANPGSAWQQVLNGANYFAVCQTTEGLDKKEAQEIVRGLRAVGRGTLPEFVSEHACHASRPGRWFEVRATRAILGRRVLLVLAHTDITRRKQAELSMRASEERLQLVMQAACDGLWDWDIRTGLAYLSPRYYEMAGYSAGDVVPDFDFFKRLVHPEDLAFVLETIQAQLMARTAECQFECRMLTRDGTVFWVLSRGKVVRRDRHGAPLRMVGTLSDITERKRAEQALVRSREALRELMARMDKVREEERTRIAREIHDELGHTMTVLKFDLAWLARRLAEAGVTARSPLRRRISAMDRRVDEDVRRVRKIATDLRPPVLDALGLGAAIEWQAREFQERTGIPCALGLTTLPALDAAQANALFRTFQELLTNVARHAHATRVDVSLAADEGSVVLRVADDGNGPPPADAIDPHALGLLGIRERTAALGGRMVIQGARGRGMTVEVCLPLRPT